MTIAFYIATILVVVTPVLSIPQSRFAGFVANLSDSDSIGYLFSGMVKWLLIEIVWLNIEGGQVPIAVMGTFFIYSAIRCIYWRKKLPEAEFAMRFSEQWSIILIGIAIGVQQYGIRWY